MRLNPIASQILRHKWAIDVQYALNAGPIISGILNGNMVDPVLSDEDNAPKAAISGKSAVTYYNWDDAPQGSVALIDLKGELMKDSQFCGPLGMAAIGKRIRQADRDPRFSGIILRIDSPGGTVDGTETLANVVKSTNKPVLAYVDGLMASAAAWIGTGANEIWASTDTDEIGSIGVLMSFWDIIPAYELMGFKFHMVTASTSKEKVKKFQELRAGNYENYIKEVLDPLDEKFMNVIKENRPDVTDEHLSGKVFFARDVMGTLIDRIGSFDDAIARVQEIGTAGLGKRAKLNSNNSISMKQFTILNRILGVDSLESVDEQVSMNEEQLQLIEDALTSSEDNSSDLETARNELAEEREARKGDLQSIADLKDANKSLREENESLKKAASGGSAAAIDDNDDAGEDKKEKADTGAIVSDDDDFLTAMDKLAEERKSF